MKDSINVEAVRGIMEYAVCVVGYVVIWIVGGVRSETLKMVWIGVSWGRGQWVPYGIDL